MLMKTIFVIPSVFLVLGIIAAFGKVNADAGGNALTGYTTTNGHNCITACEKRGSEYNWCYIQGKNWEYPHGHWDYCSAQPGTTFRGETCTTPCSNEKYSNYTCYTDSAHEKYDYCGKSQGNPDKSCRRVNQYKTAEGKNCVSECSKAKDTTYYWCYTSTSNTDWDYCSAKPGYDKEGKKCKDACDYHEGKAYTWCHLEEGGWDKCGVRSVSSEIEYTYIGSKCVSPCQLNNTGTGNECYDASNNARGCSKFANYAVDNKKCSTACDLRGGVSSNKESAYNWCTTKGGSWSYCSNSCKWDGKLGDGDDFSVENIPITVIITGNRINIFWFRVDLGSYHATFMEWIINSNTQVSVEGNQDLQGWLFGCLLNWQRGNYTIPNDNVDTVTTLVIFGQMENGVQLEQSKRYQWNGVWYRDFQILVNGATGDKGNTVASVRCSESVARYNPQLLLNALITSAYHSKTVHACRFSYAQ